MGSVVYGYTWLWELPRLPTYEQHHILVIKSLEICVSRCGPSYPTAVFTDQSLTSTSSTSTSASTSTGTGSTGTSTSDTSASAGSTGSGTSTSTGSGAAAAAQGLQ